MTIYAYSSHEAAIARISVEPERSQQLMRAQYSAACHGWVLYWLRSDGTTRMLTDTGWVDIWRSPVEPAVRLVA